MEDVATAEIARSQIWQWVANEVTLDTGAVVTADLVRRTIDEELAAIRAAVGDEQFAASHYDQARGVFEQVALADDYVEFLTYPAYELLP